MAIHHGGDWHSLSCTSPFLSLKHTAHRHTNIQPQTHAHEHTRTNTPRIRGAGWSTAYCRQEPHRPGYIFRSGNKISETLSLTRKHTCQSNAVNLCPEYKLIWRLGRLDNISIVLPQCCRHTILNRVIKGNWQTETFPNGSHNFH